MIREISLLRNTKEEYNNTYGGQIRKWTSENTTEREYERLFMEYGGGGGGGGDRQGTDRWGAIALPFYQENISPQERLGGTQ